MPFRDLVDQDHAIFLLRTAVRTGRVSHAYLFVGPPGVGRSGAALAFAQLLNCERPADGDACGQCHACTLIASGQHPDVRVVDLDEGKRLDPEDTTTTGIGIKQILALRREVVFPPFQGKWKVYVFVNAETMTTEAANSLLKVLEEPPERVVIILIAESPVPLLPTVVSRCQLVRFSLIPGPAIERVLIDRYKLPASKVRFVAALSGGQLGRAVEWVTSEEAQQRRETILDLMDRLEDADPLDRLDAAEQLSKEKDDLPELLEIALFWYRDILVWQQTATDERLINLDRKDRIVARAASLTSAVLNKRLLAVEDAKDALRRNVHPRLLLETLFLRMAPPTEPTAGRRS
ncbi:MAG TPA: DNA polymerase III subunit delta' [bacterium]